MFETGSNPSTRATGTGFCQGVRKSVPWPVPQVNPWQNPWHSLVASFTTGIACMYGAMPVMMACFHRYNAKESPAHCPSSWTFITSKGTPRRRYSSVEPIWMPWPCRGSRLAARAALATVRGLPLPLPKSLLPLKLASALSHFRPIFRNFWKNLRLPHIIFRSALSWVTAGRLPKVVCFCLYFHYGVIPSCHLLSYSHGAILLFYLFSIIPL